MKRISLFIFIHLSFLLSVIGAQSFDSEKTNLIIVYPDQMRGQAMGFVGQEPVQTPYLDRFASQGLVLTEAVSNYPICSPTRASLMTGQYPQGHGVWGNSNTITAPFGYELKETAQTWSDILDNQGYSLGYIGKWHLDSPHAPYINTLNNAGKVKWNEWTHPDRRHGFDFWYAYGTYDQHNKPMYWAGSATRDSFNYVHQWGPEHETDLAIKYIKNENEVYRDPSQPFALMIAMNPPHMPYAAVPERYKAIYNDIPLDSLIQRPNIPAAGTKWGDYYRKHIRNYYAMITGVDEQFGRILNVLKKTGLEKNTIVLFSSDHGNCLGIHDQISKNNHYEESMRIPFIIRWPGKINPRQDKLLISTPDVFPTLLGLLGFTEKIMNEIDGIDYSSLFLSGENVRPRSQLYIYTPPGKIDMGRRGIRTHQFTLMMSRIESEADQITLYDNLSDMYQLNNIATERQDVIKELKGELKMWLEKTNDPWIKHLK